MDRDLHDFFGPPSNHRLTVDEKESIYSELVSIRKAPPATSEYSGSFLWRALHSFSGAWAPVAAVVIILVLSGAGITAAQSSLPGDFLYPLKKVHESIQTNLRFTAESKAEVAGEHMDARLDEAAALEVKGELNEATTDQLDQEYRLERREATKNIQQLEAEGNQEAAARMRARLNATEDRYEKVFKGRTRGNEPVLRDADQFPSIKKVVSSMSSAVTSSAETTMSAAAEIGETASSSLSSVSSSASPDRRGDASVSAGADAKIDASAGAGMSSSGAPDTGAGISDSVNKAVNDAGAAADGAIDANGSMDLGL